MRAAGRSRAPTFARAMRAVDALAAAALAGALTLSCAVDDAANPGARCDDAGRCPAGLVCHRGFCISGEGAECTMEGEVLPCYSGPTGTERVGMCRPGMRECRSGVYTACLGEVIPTTEGADTTGRACNGDDDDCDGVVDEFDEASCLTGEVGACAAGELRCEGGAGACARLSDPSAEVCNGGDDDCDGMTDEATDSECWPGGDGCTDAGDGTFACMGICEAGTQRCGDGALEACAGAVLAAAGDDGCTPPGDTAEDDDCDGTTDEDCACLLATAQNCYGGPSGTVGVGTCRMGMQTCEEVTPGTNRYGPCAGAVVPAAEACANEGADDDCDGVTDDIPMRGAPCTDPMLLGVCRSGTLECPGGGMPISCVTEMASMETCNGLDDDCDGMVDDGFDLLGDEANCGTCGNACGMGLTCCDGTCVSVATHTSHCGTCGNACGAGVTCCGGACADTQVDPLHCGGCGAACGSSESCCDGACTDPRLDELNCGTCGTTCGAGTQCCLGMCRAPTAPECGACIPDCTGSLTCCSGACLDTTGDRNNCGACGNACTAGRLCCGGACVSGATVMNCGACGNACAAGQLCCMGACVPSDAANCGACGAMCGSGQDCCTGTCLGTRMDDLNCGSCGNVCPPSSRCSNGVCCAAGLTGCEGACFDLSTDDRHCGRCGFRCRGSERCRTGCCENGGGDRRCAPAG